VGFAVTYWAFVMEQVVFALKKAAYL